MRPCDTFRDDLPAFDAALELLACLTSDRNNAARLADLADDFGSPQQQVRELIAELRTRGWDVRVTQHVGSGYVVYLGARNARRAREESREYLARIEMQAAKRPKPAATRR